MRLFRKKIKKIIYLHKATRRRHVEIVNILISNNATINAKTKDGSTALMIAVEKGYHEIVKILINNGADVNAFNKDENTSLILGIYLLCFRLIVLNYAKGFLKSLHYLCIQACIHGYKGIAELLIENKANVNGKDKNEHTSLMQG